ncbi:MAG: protein tyrosine phosphatase [Actinomycetota bacterium]|nr:protein tyrosine phosphatase [Actinomycetota bacterium]
MSFFTALVTSKIAAATLAAGTLAVGGTGAAAYSNILPTAVQQGAHNLIGAPAPHTAVSVGTRASASSTGTPSAKATSTESAKVTGSASEGASDSVAAKATETATGKASSSLTPSDLPVGPDATRAAVHGLCEAYTTGGLDAASTAYSSLVAAAKGSTNIVTYCASIPAQGQSDSRAAAGTDADAKTAIPALPATPALPSQAATSQLPTQAVNGAVHQLIGRP